MSTVTSMRVLVIDDDDEAAMSLAILLKHLGQEAAVAEGGKAALQLAQVFRPDAMFINLTMPKIGGLTLARRFRQTPEFAHTPLVAVTGCVDAKHRVQATSAGFTDFLPKPYPLVQLQETLARVGTRIEGGRVQLERLRQAAEQSRCLVDRSRQGLDDYWRRARLSGVVPVFVEKSGVSSLLSVAEMPDAEELRCWLKYQRCRVGSIFAPTPGRFAFFVYSRRHLIGDLIARHGGFRSEGPGAADSRC